MVKVAHVLILAFCIVVCPMRCMGMPVGSECAQLVQTSPGCCGHCARHEQSGNPQDAHPPADSDDCVCGSCLCNGGKLDDGQVDISELSIACWAFISEIQAPLSGDAAASCFRSCHWPYLDSGRDVYMLTCALLL